MIEKYYKKNKTKNILTIKFTNYLNSNLFISLDYYKKDKTFKLTWVNLDLEDPIKYICVEVLELIEANHIMSLILNREKIEVPNKDKSNIDLVEIDINYGVELDKPIHYEYNRYIPKEYISIVEPLILISKNLPTKLDHYFIMMLASITGEEYKYDYLNTVKLNILRGNVDKLFQPNIIEVGKLLHDKIKFIEKVDNDYFALVEDLVDYAVIIKEAKKGRVMLNCTCPREYYCEHIYATLHAIKEKKEVPFYKVLYNDQNADLLDKITNNKVVLATCIKDDKIELINDLGQIGLLPIINNNNKCNWTVVEDDENKSLTKKLEEMESACNVD